MGKVKQLIDWDKLDKLQALADQFEMDVDLEAFTLVPFSQHTEPKWKTNWKSKLADSDYMPEDSEEYDERS